MGTDFEYKTDFLFSEGSVALGAGSVLDLTGSYLSYNLSPNGEEADRRAIVSDWGVIGQDLKKAISAWETANDRKSK